MWKLVIEDDEAKRTSVPLTRDDYTIGRKEGNTIRLTERNVSREHAKIHKSNGAHPQDSPFVLEDMNSYNGVYVNGLRVAQPQKLQHGDLIQIGDYRIILQDEALTEAETGGGAATTQDMKSTVPAGVVSRASLLLERPNRLVMLAGPTPGAEYPLDQDRTTIGRAEDCTISVNHNSVSRLHCEVHTLGENRYEVVDKGSSNGVRVNGSDLRRSIVEPGDVIELGDVRFRFVGAGQIFLPGVGDHQQLEAIPDRPPTALRPAQASTTSLVPFVVVGALVAVAVVVGFAVFQHQQQQSQPVPVADTSHTQDDPEQIAVQAAKKECDQGNCDVGHMMLVAKVAKTSPIRQSSDFQNVETRWADQVLAQVDKEPDPMKKRTLLHSITGDEGVPLTRRNVATAKLAELDAAATVHPTATNEIEIPEPTHTATSPTHTPTVSTSTAVSPAHTSHPTHTKKNVLQQASALSLAGDNAGARALLEKDVFGGRGSPEEVRLLKGICKAQHDKECIGAIDKKYP
jgi:pSer/pThr/pTyr-binding forkhead associated (FHA) protein